MSILHRTRTAPAALSAAATTEPSSGEPGPGPGPAPSASAVPRTRTGAAWLALCATALAFVVLIVFMLQNTRSTEIHFLGLHGTLPLALALLIAAVGSAIITLVVGTARITQLRRFSRRPR